jgi:hypothetical protein
MRIPLYLAVAQWALIFALGLLVIVMYRQLGRLFDHSKASAGLGPDVGQRAAEFGYERIGDGSRHYLTPGDGQPALVAFVDPTCPACEQLVDNLGVLHQAGELSPLRVLLLTSDPPDYLQISDSFRTTGLDIARVTTHGVREDYKAVATPLLVAIGGDGTVRAAGSVRQLKEVRGFAHACLQPAPPAPGAALPLVPSAASAASAGTEPGLTMTEQAARPPGRQPEGGST